MSINDGAAAFPNSSSREFNSHQERYYEIPGRPGMSLRQYAAIKLREPNSGTDWLDDMIRESLRNEIAAKAMHQFLHGSVLPVGYNAEKDLKQLRLISYQVADAMLEERRP